jgi:hypothetical protein
VERAFSPSPSANPRTRVLEKSNDDDYYRRPYVRTSVRFGRIEGDRADRDLRRGGRLPRRISEFRLSPSRLTRPASLFSFFIFFCVCFYSVFLSVLFFLPPFFLSKKKRVIFSRSRSPVLFVFRNTSSIDPEAFRYDI